MTEGDNLIEVSIATELKNGKVRMKDSRETASRHRGKMSKSMSESKGPLNQNQEIGYVSEDMLRMIVESAPNGMLMTDEKGKILYLNPQIEKMFGYSKSELLGQHVEELVPQRYSESHATYRKKYIAEPEARVMGNGRDLFAQHKDGTEIPVEIGLNPVKTEQGVIVIGTVIDITERKRTEKLLIEREERLHEIMDNTTDAIVVFDNEGVVETCNRRTNALLSSGNEELRDIRDIITPENRDGFSEILKRAKGGDKITDIETEIIGKGGKRISVSASLVYTNSEVGKFIITIRDISERLMIRQKIIDLEKSQIIGKMSEGFAHHMGTPLASMLLRVQMLKEDVPDIPGCEDVSKKLDSIERQILYGQKVIQRLLKFVSKPGSEKRPESLSELLNESVEIIRPLLKKNRIAVELNTPEDLRVLADSNLMQLVFSDTLMNAVDAMPGGGIISITAFGEDGTETAEVKISDMGHGIAQETIPHVFEPFYTTKPAGKGTGLGLSVAKRVINDHGGEISISSKVDSGTTVLIKLPILNAEARC